MPDRRGARNSKGGGPCSDSPTDYRDDKPPTMSFSAEARQAAHKETAENTAVLCGGGHWVGLRRRAKRPDGWGLMGVYFGSLADALNPRTPYKASRRAFVR